MKSLIITGTLITEKTAPGYIDRMCHHILEENFDMISCHVLQDIENKVVNAGLITWEQVGEIENKYYEI